MCLDLDPTHVTCVQGVMTYEMLVGYSRFPFNASDEDELYDKIKNKEPRFPRTFTNLTEVDIYIIYTTVPAELSTFGWTM